MPEANFPELFKHCKIGTVDLPNQIVLPPMTTNFSNQWWVSERFEDYYVKRAKGGAGLIIVEDECGLAALPPGQ
jgi:2,4-dienoyl-CoA reductase-like NADH-dependent reductase (Old Yellow Enzyme family)